MREEKYMDYDIEMNKKDYQREKEARAKRLEAYAEAIQTITLQKSSKVIEELIEERQSKPPTLSQPFSWHFSTSSSCSRPVILSKPSMGPPPFVCCLAGGVLAMGARCESEQTCVLARRRRPRRV